MEPEAPDAAAGSRPAHDPNGPGPSTATAGWVKRFVVTPDRAREAADLYRRLGHEVRVEPAAEEDLPSGCGDCALARGLYRTVYTRRNT